MRRLGGLLLALAASAALAGCAAIQSGANSAGNAMCANADSLRMGWLMARQNALMIPNPVLAQSLVGAADAALAGLATCPGTVPVPPTVGAENAP